MTVVLLFIVAVAANFPTTLFTEKIVISLVVEKSSLMRNTRVKSLQISTIIAKLEGS